MAARGDLQYRSVLLAPPKKLLALRMDRECERVFQLLLYWKHEGVWGYGDTEVGLRETEFRRLAPAASLWLFPSETKAERTTLQTKLRLVHYLSFTVITLRWD